MQSTLDAVNKLLSALGDGPQNALDETNPDIAIAVMYIESASEDVQSEGWWFNTEVWDMELDVDGKQALPNDSLYVNTANPNWIARNGFLYDAENHTYIFEADAVSEKTMTVINKLDLDELPPIVYNYVINTAKIGFLSELEGEFNKAKTAASLAQKQYIQMKKLQLEFSAPNAVNSPTASKLLRNIPVI